MGCLSMENLIMRMGDRSLPRNPYHVPVPHTHVLILYMSRLQSLPLLAPHTRAPYWPTSFFWGTTPAPTPTPTPLTFNSAMCNCPAPLFCPTCIAHLLMAHRVHCQGVVHCQGCQYQLQLNS